jgi:hypothetical protein
VDGRRNTGPGARLASIAQLAESVLDPQHAGWSLRACGEAVGMNAGTVSHVSRDARFLPWLREARARTLTPRVDEVVQAAIESAMLPGRDGHPDRRLVLELAGAVDVPGRAALAQAAPQVTVVYVGDWRAPGVSPGMSVPDEADVVDAEVVEA